MSITQQHNNHNVTHTSRRQALRCGVMVVAMAITSIFIFVCIQSGYRQWLLPPLICSADLTVRSDDDEKCETTCLFRQSKLAKKQWPDGAYWDVTSMGLACRKVVSGSKCEQTALIVASAFTTLQSAYDDSRGRATVRELRQKGGVLDFICPFYRSAVGLGTGRSIELIVMHDQKAFSREAALEHCRPEDFGRTASPETVVTFFYYPAKPAFHNAQDARFFAAEALLESRPDIDCVMLSDGRDVVVHADPRPVLSMAVLQGRLILQMAVVETADLEEGKPFYRFFHDDSGESELRPGATESTTGSDPDLVEVAHRVRMWATAGWEHLSGQPGATAHPYLLPHVVNCAIIGGHRDTVLFFLKQLNLVLRAFKPLGQQPVDWAGTNYVASMVFGNDYIGLEARYGIPYQHGLDGEPENLMLKPGQRLAMLHTLKHHPGGIEASRKMFHQFMVDNDAGGGEGVAAGADRERGGSVGAHANGQHVS